MAFDVTDRWLEDPRRGLLIEKIGEITTDGTAFKLWRLAFLYFKKGELVPADLFNRVPNSDLFVQEGLAERRTDGVYIRGSKDAFKWYDAGITQRSEAGKRSAEARRKKFGSAIPINASNGAPDQSPNAPQRDRTDSERKPNETEPLVPVPPLSPDSEPVAGDTRARGAPAAAAEANAIEGSALRAILGQDQNSNLGRALGTVPADILADWRTRWTDESIRKTAKKIVNKLLSREGSFDKVNWRVRLTSCMEGERESLVRRPLPKTADSPPPEQLFDVPAPTPEALAAAARKGFKAPSEVAARLAAQKTMPGKTA